MNERGININIDELILDGLDPGHREYVVGALQKELQRLFVVTGLPLAYPSGPLDLDLSECQLEISSSNNPEQIGCDIARALHQQIRRSQPAPTQTVVAPERRIMPSGPAYDMMPPTRNFFETADLEVDRG